MTIKERESQLALNLNLQIIFSVLIWLLSVSFMGYRFWNLQTPPESPLTIGNNVPTIRQSNIDILQASIKQIETSNLPTIRAEPFD